MNTNPYESPAAVEERKPDYRGAVVLAAFCLYVIGLIVCAASIPVICVLESFWVSLWMIAVGGGVALAALAIAWLVCNFWKEPAKC